MIDYSRFDALTFDCYGTLIDWETGIVSGLRTRLGAAAQGLADDDLLARYADVEHVVEAEYRPYREVVGTCLRLVAKGLGATVSGAQEAAFADSVGDWLPFPDSPGALARLSERFTLAVVTNCDDDLFARSEARLGLRFDHVITAQQVGGYKPSHRNFHAAWERLGLPPERILHVAQSLFHDHVPAKALGMASVWIDRRSAKGSRGGASLDADVTPDATYPDMASFADAALAG